MPIAALAEMALAVQVRPDLLPLLQKYARPFLTPRDVMEALAELRPTASTADMEEAAVNFVGNVNDANAMAGGARCCSAEDAIRFVASYGEATDQIFAKLEERIEIPARFFKGGGGAKTNPVYMKTSMGFGSKPVADIHKSSKWFGLNGKFTDGFTGGMPTASGLTTSFTKSRVHAKLDGASDS